MYRAGEKVIYPGHGIAEIRKIEKREINGKLMEFYYLTIVDENLSLMVPKGNEKKIGMRKVISPEEVEKVYNILKSKANLTYKQWHHRYQENFEKLKSGSIYETAEVVRDLAYLERKKSLAVKESRMMHDAKKLIIKEIAYTKKMSEKEVARQINELLSTN